MNKNFTKNLLQRFSCSITGRGKKASGYKILLESLFHLRENSNLFVFNKNDLRKNFEKESLKRSSLLSLSSFSSLETKSSDTSLSLSSHDSTFYSPTEKIKQIRKNIFAAFRFKPSKKIIPARSSNNLLKKDSIIHKKFRITDTKIVTKTTKNQKITMERYPINLLTRNTLQQENNKIYKTAINQNIRSLKNQNDKANFDEKKTWSQKILSKQISVLAYNPIFDTPKTTCSALQTTPSVHSFKIRKTNHFVREFTTLQSLKKFALKGKSNYSFCVDCISAVKPILETRKLRKGRMTYRVPKITPPQRQESKAISLLLEQANSYSSPLHLKDLFEFSLQTTQLESVKNFISTSNIKIDEKTKASSTSSTLERTPDFNNTIDSRKKTKSNFLTFSSAFTLFDSKKQQRGKIQLIDKNLFLTNSLPKIIELVSEPSKEISASIEKIDENDIVVPNFFNKKESQGERPLKEVFQKQSLLKKNTEEHFVKSSIFSKKDNGASRGQNKQSIKNCLSLAFFDSGHGKGESIEKKKQLHKFALQNRAYLHFRWW